MFDKAFSSKHLSDKISARYFPKPSVDISDTKQARAAVYDWILSEYHPIGSCAMGDCVDTHLRVKGTRNLRVVDASVFPNHVSGNIVASVVRIRMGERVTPITQLRCGVLRSPRSLPLNLRHMLTTLLISTR